MSGDPHPALRWALEAMLARGERQRALRERRRRALARPEAAAEWALAEAETDVLFSLYDERDAAIAGLDARAVEQEHRDDDGDRGADEP
jgi:hypothetical protein